MTRTWKASYLHDRDVYRIVGEAPDGSPPWVLEIDALMAMRLAQGPGNAERLLFQFCQTAAGAGMSAADACRLLQHKIAHEQAQRDYQQHQAAMQQLNQLNGGFGYGSQQFQNAQQAMQQAMLQPQQGFNNNAAGLQAALLGQGVGGWGQQAPSPASALWDKPTKIETEMLAYRGWKLDLEYSGVTDDDRVACEIVLRSVSNAVKWPGPVLRADREPSPANENGIYAVGTDDRHNGNFNGYVAVSPVWGEVSLSGLVVEGHNGYRAEVCTIRRLWLNPTRDPVLPWALPNEALARVLAQRYQVDTPTPLLPVFAVVQEMERARKDRDAMFTQATGSVVP